MINQKQINYFRENKLKEYQDWVKENPLTSSSVRPQNMQNVNFKNKRLGKKHSSK